MTNFDRDLRSGLVLYALIVNYWPAMLAYRNELHQSPEIELQYQENAAVVVKCVVVARFRIFMLVCGVRLLQMLAASL